MNEGIFSRVRLIAGDQGLARLSGARIILFGVGGVGSWCAESLIRSGVGHLTIVDNDIVAVSNINRQLQATVSSVGDVKVDALKRHLEEINPEARIEGVREIYCTETASRFNLEDYDIIIDCIDSLSDKALLIERATRSGRKFFSSMGAALKMDPTKIRVDEFWKVKGCPLARALRQRFKKTGIYPARKFLCVYSGELLENKAEAAEDDTAQLDNYGSTRKARINGALHHITSIFGLMLAGLAIEEILNDTAAMNQQIPAKS